ncbi:MAG: hypothetical protein K8F36_13445 [Melioribacteraceae bacterium]|nr:hypothetical protein [Melioribacteraceae bacterium]
MGFLEDYANYFLFIAFFLTTFLTKKMVVKFNKLYLTIDKIDESSKHQIRFLDSVKFDNLYREKYKQFVNTELDKILLQDRNHKIAFVLIQILIFIFFMIFSFILRFNIEPDGNWNFSQSFYPFSFYSNQLKDFILWVVITPPVIYLVIMFVSTVIKINKKIDSDNRFNINPLAPDRVGGLRELGQLTLIFFYITIVQFLHFFATSLIHDFPLFHYILYPLYFLFTIIIFFAPIYSVRKAMQIGKEKELKRINDAFLKVRQKIDYELDENASQRLLEFKRLYKEAEKMPVWPFDIETFSKFGSVFLIPIIVFIVQLITDSGSILYNLDKIKIWTNF